MTDDEIREAAPDLFAAAPTPSKWKFGCLLALAFAAFFCLIFTLSTYTWFSGTYDKLNSGDQAVDSAWANVESAMQRRADLIPNIAEAAKGYATHEKDVFTEVAEARAGLNKVTASTDPSHDPSAMQKLVYANNAMSGAIGRMIVVAESYPELKADKHFSDLITELEGTENRINVARGRYNTAVETQNTICGGFTTQLVATAGKFQKREYFKADVSAKTAPKVKF